MWCFSMDYLTELQKKRRENLKRLLADYNTQRDFGNAVGLAVTQVSNIVTGVREMGEEIARRIESALGKPPGWLDRVDLDQEPTHETVLAALPADQAKLLLGYRRLSPKYQEAIRDATAAYELLEHSRQRA